MCKILDIDVDRLPDRRLEMLVSFENGEASKLKITDVQALQLIIELAASVMESR